MSAPTVESRLCWEAIRLFGTRMDLSEAELLLPFLSPEAPREVQQTALQVIQGFHSRFIPSGPLPEEVRNRIHELAETWLLPLAVADVGVYAAFSANILACCELYSIPHPDPASEWAALVRRQTDIIKERIKFVTDREDPKTPIKKALLAAAREACKRGIYLDDFSAMLGDATSTAYEQARRS